MDLVLFLETFEDNFNDAFMDCNEHVKAAMEKVLLLIKETIPNILEEKKKVDFEKKVHLMWACVLLFVYYYADMNKL